MNILELLKPSDKIALVQNNKGISYDQLLDKGLRFGSLLYSHGIKSGDHVLIFTPLSIQLYISMIGTWAIGAIPIFIDFSRGSKFVNDSINILTPNVIVCDTVTALVRYKYANMRKIKMLKVTKTFSSRVDIKNTESSHPAIMTFTSGTTGQPKVAVRTHGFLINQYQVLKKHIDFCESHIDFGTLPVFTLANLAAGMTTILPNNSYNKLKLPSNLSSITRAICSPAIFEAMSKKSELPNLQQVYLGGAPVYPSLLKKIRDDIEIHIVYGSTEAEPIASIKWNTLSQEDKEKMANGEGLLAGEIVPDIELKIAQNSEIIVCGDTVLKRYYKGLGDRENKIIDGDKIWHRTGDAGFIDSQGRLWLLGRVSQAISDKHGMLYPFSVECVLDTHFGIRGATLLHNGKRTVVVDKDVNVREILSQFKIEDIKKVKKLPMDKRHNAKIDYAALKNILISPKGIK